MRNLYKPLKANPSWSAQSLAQAISALPASRFKEDAEAVLLNPARRKIYDRNWGSCKEIGVLRARLGMRASRYWSKDECDDFIAPVAEYRVFDDLFRSGKEPAPHEHSRSSGGIKAYHVVLVLIIVIFAWIYLKKPSITSKQSRGIPQSELSQNKKVSEEDFNLDQKRAVLNTERGSLTPSEISALQKMLNERNYDAGIEDGKVGHKTKKAIAQFEKDHSLKITEDASWGLFVIVSNTPLPLPHTRVLSKNGNSFVAPLEIVTSPGVNYYIKLVKAYTDGPPVLVGFIRGGQKLSTDAPLGAYELKYATGKNWFGTRDIFGPDTNYYKAGKVLTFRKEASGYSGYTIELIKQVHGNLPTRTISPSTF